MDKTNEKWKYVLNSISLGEVELTDTPSGWDTQKVSMSRSMKYLGLFREFSTSLRFFGDGLDYIMDVYERNGSEHEITIEICEYVGKPTDKFEIFFEGVIDLSTYTNEENKFIEVDINDSSFANKIISRDDIRIDLSATESIEGTVLDENETVQVLLHQRELPLTGFYEVDSSVSEVSSTPSVIGGSTEEGYALPMKIAGTDIDNLLDPVNPILDDLDSIWYGETDILSSIQIKGSITGNYGIGGTNLPDNQDIILVFRNYTDSSMQSFTDFSPLDTISNIQSGSRIVTTDVDTNYSIAAGNVVALVAYIDPGDSGVGFTTDYSSIDITITKTELLSSSFSDGYLAHEVGARLIDVMTDTSGKFVSEVFGRTDINYPENGKYSNISLHSSGSIRRLPDATASISFSDWFKSKSAMFNLAAGIEYNNVGKPYLRVDELSHFFNGRVIASLHSVTKMTKTFAREWVYNSIKCGYDKVATEEVAGLGEYNNKFTWATKIRTVKNDFDLVSKIRADGTGIEKMRQLSFETDPTEDTKEYNDNFAIAVEKTGVNYEALRDQEYDTVENINSPDTAYNLDLSPGHNLRRNGSKIRAGLDKYLDVSIKFQHADQNSSMITKRTDESITIDEGEDIDVRTLDEGLWITDIYSCEFVLDRDLYKSILKNPGGIMKLSTGTQKNTKNYQYGWILNIEYNPETDKSVGEFLRVNLNNTNVILVDPDGNSPDIIPPEQPTTITGALESLLPLIFTGPEYQDIETTVYTFSGNDVLIVSGVPSFERTSTFYFKSKGKNFSEGTSSIDNIYDTRDVNGEHGINIRINNIGNLDIFLIGDNQVISVRGQTEMTYGVCYEMEVWYDGTSLGTGVSASINGASETLDILSPSLTTSMANDGGAAIGRYYKRVSSNVGMDIDNILMQYDGVSVLEYDCSAVNYDRTAHDLSGTGSDGAVNLNGTDETVFYTNNSCVPVVETFYQLLETGDIQLLETDDIKLLEDG